jgi:DNA-binding NarL/FixJ family response regulator
MNHLEIPLKSPTQTPARNGGMSHDYEAEAYWDRLTDDDRRLIWLTASGKGIREIAADCAETPRKVAQRYRTLLGKLGLDDRLSLVLAAVTRTAQAPVTTRRVEDHNRPFQEYESGELGSRA